MAECDKCKGYKVQRFVCPHCDKIADLKAQLYQAKAEIAEAKKWCPDGDEAIKEDDEIKACHPVSGGRDDLYMEALRMVSAKRSKYALVDLVNMVLHRVAEKDRVIKVLVEKADGVLNVSESLFSMTAGEVNEKYEELAQAVRQAKATAVANASDM